MAMPDESPDFEFDVCVVGGCGHVGLPLAIMLAHRELRVAIDDINKSAVRYLDIVLFVYPVALVALLVFAEESSAATRFGRYGRPVAAAWVITVVAAIALLGGFGSVRGAIDWSNSVRQQMGNVQSYLATGNVDLKPAGGDALTIDLYYPHPERLAKVLEIPDVRAILPAELRPANADNAGARNRMWLRGALSGVTATAVHLMLLWVPGCLRLGSSRSASPEHGEVPAGPWQSAEFHPQCMSSGSKVCGCAFKVEQACP